MATPRQVLDLPLPEGNDAGAATVRDYLVELLATLWSEGEGFSGKRPFGNSGWEYDLYTALGKAGLIDGLTFDEDGYVDAFPDSSRREAGALIFAAIRELR